MRLLVSVTTDKLQLLWRPLRIAVDIEERMNLSPESGDQWIKAMEMRGQYL